LPVWRLAKGIAQRHYRFCNSRLTTVCPKFGRSKWNMTPDLKSLYRDPRFITMVADAKERAAVNQNLRIEVLNPLPRTEHPQAKSRKNFGADEVAQD